MNVIADCSKYFRFPFPFFETNFNKNNGSIINKSQQLQRKYALYFANIIENL